MIDVLFAHSYLLSLDPEQSDKGKPYPPLGTLYAAAHVRGLGYSVALHDLTFEQSERSLEQSLDRYLPSLLVIHDDRFHPGLHARPSRRREVVLQMVSMATRRGIPVIVSSVDSVEESGVYLEAGATLVIIGEGEMTLGEATQALIGAPRRGEPGLPRNGRAEVLRRDVRSIAGLVYLSDAGTTVCTEARPPILNLDLLLPPAWDLIDIESYRKYWLSRHGRFSLNVSATRVWPSRETGEQSHALRAPASVATEWSELKRAFHPDHLWVSDFVFGLDASWVSKLRDELVARDAAIPFTLRSRAESLDQETVRALAEAGCEMAWIGLESGATRSDERRPLRQIEAARARLKDAGLRFGLRLRFDGTSEGWEEMLRATRTLLPEAISVSLSAPASIAFHRALDRRLHAELQLRRGLELLRRAVRERALGTHFSGVLRASRDALLLPVYILRLRILGRPKPVSQ